MEELGQPKYKNGRGTLPLPHFGFLLLHTTTCFPPILPFVIFCFCKIRWLGMPPATQQVQTDWLITRKDQRLLATEERGCMKACDLLPKELDILPESNANLRSVQHFIVPVSMSCHGLWFSLPAVCTEKPGPKRDHGICTGPDFCAMENLAFSLPSDIMPESKSRNLRRFHYRKAANGGRCGHTV